MSSIEIICFTGNSGLTDYSVSLARVLGKRATLVTAESLPLRFRVLGFSVITQFRRSRHYPLDIIRFVYGVLQRRPKWTLWQGPLKFALFDGLVVRFLRLLGFKCAVTVHDVLPHTPWISSRFTYGFYYRSFDRVVVHSDASLAAMKSFGVSAPILVIPHGTYDLFKLTNINQVNARNLLSNIVNTTLDSPIAIFFGHLQTRKGIFELIDVARLLKKSGSPLVFLIAGSPILTNIEFSYLKNVCKELSNVVLFQEHVAFEDVEIFFTAADIVLLPYQEGTTSGVLKIALAFKLPVIASAVGDFPEQINNDSGIIVPLGENFVERFAEQLINMAINLEDWKGKASLNNDYLEWSSIANKIQDFLDA